MLTLNDAPQYDGFRDLALYLNGKFAYSDVDVCDSEDKNCRKQKVFNSILPSGNRKSTSSTISFSILILPVSNLAQKMRVNAKQM